MGEFMGRAWEHGAWSTKTTKGFRSYKLFVCSMIQEALVKTRTGPDRKSDGSEQERQPSHAHRVGSEVGVI